MPGGSRKKPFSGKQKKQQLLVKREKQQAKELSHGLPSEFNSRSGRDHTQGSSSGSSKSNDPRVQHKNEFTTTLEEASEFGEKFFEVRPSCNKNDGARYALMFRKENKEELEKQRQEGRKIIHRVLEEYLECKVEDFFTDELNFPVRPAWNYDLSRVQLETNEYTYFHNYLRQIDAKHETNDLSYFELNLETWRQLWRVLEMSDIILCVVDIRYPPLLFPPKLYNYVCLELRKHLILVLNKIDICPAPLVLAWKEYFQTKYPELHILCFTSYPSYNLVDGGASSSLQGKRRKGRMRMSSEGAFELYKVCEEIVQGEVDLSSWKAKVQDEMSDETDDEPVQVNKVVSEKADTGFYDFKKLNGGILTIGCIGQPNVGKSSLINAIMGRKVVSVSRTPGHTKHFQTIFLTPNVRLCDCPGLIFPSKIPKALQVLCGSFPIAQLREPYTTIKYLAERKNLPSILAITHPEGDSEWCACDIADGWALKRRYYTAKAARLDTYRGANHILRLALDGRISLYLYPPGYCTSKEEWKNDPRVEEILKLQAKSQSIASSQQHLLESSEDDDDEAYNDEETGEEQQNANSNDSDREKGEKPKTSKAPKKGNSSITVKNKFAMLLSDDEDEDEEN